MQEPLNGRSESFTKVRDHFLGTQGKCFVEIGMTRSRDDMGAGYSTPYFAWLAEETKSWLYSVDVVAANKALCIDLLHEMKLDSGRTLLVIQDGMKFLEEWKQYRFADKIDFLYLDAWDYDGDAERKTLSEEMHLKAFESIEGSLAENALILIDDIHDTETYIGKGRLLIPLLLSKNYKLLHKGYQFLFQKP